MKSDRILIIGQGICGTVLSSLCYRSNIPFLVIDHPSAGSASLPAAGILNPIVFKRMLPGWMAETLLPAAFKYYESMELILKEKFFHPDGIIKIIANENEENLWTKAQDSPSLTHFVSSKTPDNPYGKLLAPHHSLKLIHGAGWVDAPGFLNAWRKKLKQEQCLIEEIFRPEDLILTEENQLTYRNTAFSKVVFCEGNSVTRNPWFKHLPWVPTKGDLLLIKPAVPIPGKSILNKNGFLLPYGIDGLWLAGSTYHWNNISTEPEKKGRDELVEKIKKIIAVDFEVVEHWCGIRPGVSDRRPIIGASNIHPLLHIFNGMGTKGFLLAPGLGELFLSNKEIPGDCSPKRFAKTKPLNPSA